MTNDDTTTTTTVITSIGTPPLPPGLAETGADHGITALVALIGILVGVGLERFASRWRR